MPIINWDDPVARAKLIESAGSVEYNEAFARHVIEDAVTIVNGYPILPLETRFGRVFQVFGTDKGFTDQADAEKFAAGQEPRNANPE